MDNLIRRLKNSESRNGRRYGKNVLPLMSITSGLAYT